MRNYFVLKKKFFFSLVIITSFVVGFFSSLKTNSEKLYSKSKFYLGSIVEVKFYCNNENLANLAFEKVFNEIERIDKKYSFYIEQSYLSKLNSNKSSILSIDEETFFLLKLSDSVYNLTLGKFDPSIGALTELWKKYIEDSNPKKIYTSSIYLNTSYLNNTKTLPSESEIISSLKNSGWKNLELIEKNQIKRKNDILINLDAIIQGYAADRSIEILKSLRIKKALVNASGEIRVVGNDWKIGIRHPRIDNEMIEIVNLSNYSIATSGDYEKYIEVNGKRYHHIVDPTTGYPSTKNISITVMAKDCAFADALATGFFSLDPEVAVQIAENLEDVFVFIIDGNNQIHKSKNFEKFLRRSR